MCKCQIERRINNGRGGQILVIMAMLLFLSGCFASLDGQEQQESEVVAPLAWSLIGSDPVEWSGTIEERDFSLTALGLGENRTIVWQRKRIGDKKLLLQAATGSLKLTLSENACTHKGEVYPYQIELLHHDTHFQGCADNEGGDFATLLEGLEEIEEDTSKVASEHNRDQAQKEVVRKVEPTPPIVPKDATSLSINFSGERPHWYGSLKGRAFQFQSTSEMISESRRLSWQGENRGGKAYISSPDKSIVMVLSGKRCNGEGYVTTITIDGQAFNGCGIVE